MKRKTPPAAKKPYRQRAPGPNVVNIRSSAQAKQGVVPIPKRGNVRPG